MKTAMRNTLCFSALELSAFSPPLPKTSLTYLITIWPKRNESQAMIRRNALRRSVRAFVANAVASAVQRHGDVAR